jgi:hypothetical protein
MAPTALVLTAHQSQAKGITQKLKKIKILTKQKRMFHSTWM